MPAFTDTHSARRVWLSRANQLDLQDAVRFDIPLATVFCLQLTLPSAPVTYHLNKTEPIDFHFVNGHVETPAAPGIAGNYEGPFYRFFNMDETFNYGDGVVVKWPRDSTPSPEEQMREMQDRFLKDVDTSPACDLVKAVLENEDANPFDGILGFSEGASIAARLLLDASDERLKRRPMFAIFLCGIPPIEAELVGMVLADNTSRRIDLPTAHITGSKDVFLPAGMALYNLCQKESATRFDHGGGHALSWGLKQTQGIARAIRATVEKWETDDSALS